MTGVKKVNIIIKYTTRRVEKWCTEYLSVNQLLMMPDTMYTIIYALNQLCEKWPICVLQGGGRRIMENVFIMSAHFWGYKNTI